MRNEVHKPRKRNLLSTVFINIENDSTKNNTNMKYLKRSLNDIGTNVIDTCVPNCLIFETFEFRLIFFISLIVGSTFLSYLLQCIKNF